MTGERSPGAPLWSFPGNLENGYAASWAGSIHPVQARSFAGLAGRRVVLSAFGGGPPFQSSHGAAFKIWVNQPIGIIK
jgi:hypothetical protein